jgi:hypothetical protein
LDKYCIHNDLPKLQKRAKYWTSSFRGYYQPSYKKGLIFGNQNCCPSKVWELQMKLKISLTSRLGELSMNSLAMLNHRTMIFSMCIWRTSWMFGHVCHPHFLLRLWSATFESLSSLHTAHVPENLIVPLVLLKLETCVVLLPLVFASVLLCLLWVARVFPPTPLMPVIALRLHSHHNRLLSWQRQFGRISLEDIQGKQVGSKVIIIHFSRF